MKLISLDPPKEILVIMTGTSETASDINVQKAIQAVAEEFGSSVNMLTSMSEYAAARGTAEPARWALPLEQYRYTV